MTFQEQESVETAFGIWNSHIDSANEIMDPEQVTNWFLGLSLYNQAVSDYNTEDFNTACTRAGWARDYFSSAYTDGDYAMNWVSSANLALTLVEQIIIEYEN